MDSNMTASGCPSDDGTLLGYKPQSVRMCVTRVARERGPGSQSLFAYGYGQLSAHLGLEPAELAELVSSGRLDPLHLVELAVVRRSGPLDDASLDILRPLRPTPITDVASVRLPAAAPPLGYAAYWAVGYRDLADQVGVPRDRAWDAAKEWQRSRLDIEDLGSVLDYVERTLDPELRVTLGLVDTAEAS